MRMRVRVAHYNHGQSWAIMGMRVAYRMEVEAYGWLLREAQ